MMIARTFALASLLLAAPLVSASAAPKAKPPATTGNPSPGNGSTLSSIRCSDYLGAVFKDFTATSCSGFWMGNENAGPVPAGPVKTALQGLGLANPMYSEKKESFGKTGDFGFIDFSAPLYGVTVVGIHWGGGVFNAIPGAPNGLGTAFFVFDAGTSGVDRLYLSKTWTQSISNAALYTTGTKPPCQVANCGGNGNNVPEPSSFALVGVGLLALGGAARRRR